MKYILASFFLFCCANSLFSQSNNNIKYLDSLGHETKYGKHHYYIHFGNFNDSVNAYLVKQYTKQGLLYAQGWSEDKNTWKKTGILTNFYPDGALKSKVDYLENLPNGSVAMWYANGQKKLEGKNRVTKNNKTQKLQIENFWDEKGLQQVVNGNGFYEASDYENFGYKIIEKGLIKNGYREGDWTAASETENEKWTLKYKNQELVTGTYIDSNGKTITFSELSSKPLDKDEVTTFYRFIQKNIRIPEDLTTAGLVLTSFTIGIDGKISDFNFETEADPKLKKEIARVIFLFNKWKPATCYGKKIPAKYTLPISIL
jgi:antitoxin component YwqK of YwqJK toxin-antitoxin module